MFRDLFDYVLSRGRFSEEVKRRGAKYVNLAPTDKADNELIYFAALSRAVSDPNIHNIALTGPYGSGKSSIIRSFLKRSKKSALEISLAAFLPDAKESTSEVNTQEIERSILQQMLYGRDSGKLPLSRFKRIRAPRHWNWFISLMILVGSLTLWFLFQNRQEVISGDFFKPLDKTNWLNLAVSCFGFLFLWSVLHQIYLKSFGISLKSVSLTDVEITTDDADEESILSRHLDEIIYFFQSTSYELVVIEDLDRFNNSEIFVTLREINALVNKNDGVKRTVRFLYALRDDVFKNTDRTKFFEFIVPVVPIINHSNSIDKVLEEGQRLSLEHKLDKQFLREVSRYLTDLRLIKNIFNEFVTYECNLETGGGDNLDRNKLLAVLIYKNVKPSDFELLHQQQGTLAGIFGQQEHLVASKEADIRSQIVSIEETVTRAKKQLPRSLQELRNIYAMALIQKMPQNHSSILFEQVQIHVSQLAGHDRFEDIIRSNSVFSRTIQGHQSNLNPAAIAEEVDSNGSYFERKQAVEQRSAQQIRDYADQIQELRSRLQHVRTERFSRLVRSNAPSLQGLFSEFGESENLIRFLIFEGYLDDSYYQYISLFHSGRLSPKDDSFLKRIRGFDNPDADFKLDNKSEVVAMMRDEDFGQPYVLNRYLVDELLEKPLQYSEQLKKAVGFILGNFSSCSDFFASYYTNGKHVEALLEVLINFGDGFVAVAVESDRAADHVASLLSFIPSNTLSDDLDRDGQISSYLNVDLAAVIEVGREFDLEKLVSLELQIERLAALSEHAMVLGFLVENSLYEISADNLRIAIETSLEVHEVSGLSEQNFTTLLACGIASIIEHVEQNFETYLNAVLLKIEENTKEEPEAICRVLEHSNVDESLLFAFLEKQDAVFRSLDEVPDKFHTFLFQSLMIEPSWANVAAYARHEDFDADALTRFLRSEEAIGSLLTSSFDHSDDSLPVSQFIFSNLNFSETEYRAYVSKLPTKFKNFPKELPSALRMVLIEEDVVRLSEDSFQRAQDDPEVVAYLLAQNVAEYLDNRTLYSIDDDLRAELLVSEIEIGEKLQVIDDMDLTAAQSNPALLVRIGSVLEDADIDTNRYPSDLLLSIINHSTLVETKTKLLNKFQSALTVDEVRHAIQQFPMPFPEILEFSWSGPRIPKTPENRVLVQWLEERELISSSSLSPLWGDIKINTFRKPR